MSARDRALLLIRDDGPAGRRGHPGEGAGVGVLAGATLLNLEGDFLFFDTTSTYWERDTEDGVGELSGQAGFRRYGHSKDHRDDLPQVVIGLAVTKEGIPVRC